MLSRLAIDIFSQLDVLLKERKSVNNYPEQSEKIHI